jgi:hypothetical protein
MSASSHFGKKKSKALEEPSLAQNQKGIGISTVGNDYFSFMIVVYRVVVPVLSSLNACISENLDARGYGDVTC